jgi:hypothetical protein
MTFEKPQEEYADCEFEQSLQSGPKDVKFRHVSLLVLKRLSLDTFHCTWHHRFSESFYHK